MTDDLVRQAIRAIWTEIDGDNLDKGEQSALIRQMAEILSEPRPPGRYLAAEIVNLQRSFTDE